MSTSLPIWVSLALLLWLILYEHRQQLSAAMYVSVIKRKREGKNRSMTDKFEYYIGKECQIYTMNSQQVAGTILAIEDGWITLQNDKAQQEVINLDFVLRIREFPLNKRGKKKSVVLD